MDARLLARRSLGGGSCGCRAADGRTSPRSTATPPTDPTRRCGRSQFCDSQSRIHLLDPEHSRCQHSGHHEPIASVCRAAQPFFLSGAYIHRHLARGGRDFSRPHHGVLRKPGDRRCSGRPGRAGHQYLCCHQSRPHARAPRYQYGASTGME